MPDDWRLSAACREYPTSWWYPTRGADVTRAKAICERCSVKDICLEEALERREVFGVWGGKSERQRRTMRRGRPRIPTAERIRRTLVKYGPQPSMLALALTSGLGVSTVLRHIKNVPGITWDIEKRQGQNTRVNIRLEES